MAFEDNMQIIISPSGAGALTVWENYVNTMASDALVMQGVTMVLPISNI